MWHNKEEVWHNSEGTLNVKEEGSWHMTGTEVCQATNWIRGKREGGVSKVHVPAVLLSSVSSLYTGLRRCDRYGGMSSLPRSWDIAAIHFSTHSQYRKIFFNIPHMAKCSMCMGGTLWGSLGEWPASILAILHIF